jgi:hypothetical protein
VRVTVEIPNMILLANPLSKFKQKSVPQYIYYTKVTVVCA